MIIKSRKPILRQKFAKNKKTFALSTEESYDIELPVKDIPEILFELSHISDHLDFDYRCEDSVFIHAKDCSYNIGTGDYLTSESVSGGFALAIKYSKKSSEQQLKTVIRMYKPKSIIYSYDNDIGGFLKIIQVEEEHELVIEIPDSVVNKFEDYLEKISFK
jgi:hypothetical protein